MKPKKIDWTGLILVAAGVWVLLAGGDFAWPSWLPISTKATAATYVYEKDSGGVPAAVGSALSKLNERGIVATTHEDDATNAISEVPAQYRVTVPAAREAGLPALVIQSGDRVLRTVKEPKTEEAVLDAVP